MAEKHNCPQCGKEMEFIREDNLHIFYKCEGEHINTSEVIDVVSKYEFKKEEEENDSNEESSS